MPITLGTRFFLTTSVITGTIVSYMDSVLSERRSRHLTPDPNQEVLMEDKRMHAIVNRAFADAGYDGKVYFDTDCPKNGFLGKSRAESMFSLPIRRWGAEKAVYLGVHKPAFKYTWSDEGIREAVYSTHDYRADPHRPDQRRCTNDEMVYAFAIREAYKIKDHHDVVNHTLLAFICLLPILFFTIPARLEPLLKLRLFHEKVPFAVSCLSAAASLKLVFFLYEQLNKLCQIRADRTAILKAGVVRQLLQATSFVPHHEHSSSVDDTYTTIAEYERTKARQKYLRSHKQGNSWNTNSLTLFNLKGYQTEEADGQVDSERNIRFKQVG